MPTSRETIYAAVAYSKECEISAAIIHDDELLEIARKITETIDTLIPLVTIVVTSKLFDKQQSPYGVLESTHRKSANFFKKGLESHLGT